MRRFIFFLVIGLMLVSLVIVGFSAASSASTSGTLTGWTGNPMIGAPYTLLSLDAPVASPHLTIQWSGSGSMATAYCGVLTGPHAPPTAQDQFAFIPAWGFDATHVTGVTTVTLGCTTAAILVAVMGAAAPTLSVPGGATSTPINATSTGGATAVSTATKVPVTATTGPPTATTGLMPTMGAGDGGSTCTGAPGEVDQNGISVYVWAPGLRSSCAGAGYENGDNPMPAGAHLPAPRPFNFDAAVVAHESPFGFKIFYRPGSEAPAGYGGTNGCGDVRVIMHMGGSVAGFTTTFHTVQIAMDQCDAAGHHILDIAGRINTGVLDLRHNPDANRAQVDRLTADTLSCNGTTTFVCSTVWYAALDYAIPGASNTGWFHFGFLVEKPITLYDVSNPAAVHLTGDDGAITMLRDVQWYVPGHSGATYTVLFNTVSQRNEIVSAGTAGAWQVTVDPYYQERQVLEPSSGQDHNHSVPGLVFPN